MRHSWSFSNNPFLSARLSHEDWNVLASDHLSKLENKKDDHPVLEYVYTSYKATYETYIDQYKNWKLAYRYWKAETLEVDNLLIALSSKWIRKWDMQIQLVFESTSPEYISLLPNNRKPFQNNRRDQRIVEVGTLLKALANYPVLVDVRQEVEDFYHTLRNKRDQQQMQEQAVQDTSTKLKEAAEELGVATYRNVGSLITIYAKEPKQLLNFFKLDLIRKRWGKNKMLDKKEEAEKVIDKEVGDV